ncbi:MAG TPA: intradiol ring-cleavage dioxygenase [Candidatus Binataceae bacterium]|nr:intradiol ring-cleavage dioxygenase [Candidatus Binataceae bacterium]
MAQLTDRNITQVVLSRFGPQLDPRVRRVLTSLIEHLHDFVRDVDLTNEEWRRAVEFLTATGHITDDKRQEFVLLSDTLGVSALVDLLAHGKRAAGATQSSLLGPFYVEGAPELELGANIARTPGDPIVVRGQVTAVDGRPLPGVLLDVWQADPRGFYDVQDPTQPAMNLRGKFRTDAEGRYHFRSIKPKSYPVPHDGPVGELLRAQGRHPFRPAHIHFILSASGYHTLTTALYIAGDEYLESDAVFGARDPLVVNYQPNSDNKEEVREMIHFDFKLAPLKP